MMSSSNKNVKMTKIPSDSESEETGQVSSTGLKMSAGVILCSNGLLCWSIYRSASNSSGEKNLASRFVAGGNRSGSVSVAQYAEVLHIAGHEVCEVLCVLGSAIWK